MAVNTIRAGGLLTYPTEAVIGLGCDPRNEAAVERLLSLKRRPIEKGLIVIGANWDQLRDFLQPVTSQQLDTMLASWPGQTTWLVPCKPSVPEWLKGRFNSLAVRVPGHATARQICQEAGMALVSTSANFAGEEPSSEASQLPEEFVQQVDYVFPGEAGGAAAPSQIVDLLTGAVIRPGK